MQFNLMSRRSCNLCRYDLRRSSVLKLGIPELLPSDIHLDRQKQFPVTLSYDTERISQLQSEKLRN